MFTPKINVSTLSSNVLNVLDCRLSFFLRTLGQMVFSIAFDCYSEEPVLSGQTVLSSQPLLSGYPDNPHGWQIGPYLVLSTYKY